MSSTNDGFKPQMEQFLEWMQVRNYSKLTIASRRQYVTSFITWAEQRGLERPQEITKPILERYQQWLFHRRKKNGDPLSFRSQFNHLLPIRAWFKWLAKHNRVLYNPASELELPKLEHRLPKFVFSAAEADLVLDQTDVSRPLGIRDRAIMETIYSTGMRRMEAAALKIHDLDAERGVVNIRQGKGSTDRTVPIGDRAMAWVNRYVREVRPGLLVGDGDGDVLFLTEMGLPFNPNHLTDLVAKYIEAARVGKTGSCHLFRHTAATLMLENGADIRFIQALLGHKKLETTAIYTQVSIAKLKDIHTATHPAKLQNPKQGDA